MNRTLLIALIFFAACSSDQGSTVNKSQKQIRFYDYGLSIEFLDPFLGLQRSYRLNSDTLTVLHNTFSKEGKITKSDSISLPVMKPQLDTIYTYAVGLFSIDKENLTEMAIPKPPYSEGNMARVTFDSNFRGDRYVRDVREIDTTIDNTFSCLYRSILKTQRSR